MTTLIWCPACRAMFDKTLDACSGCGAENGRTESAFVERRRRSAARSGAWRSNLNAQAEHAVKHT